MNAEDINYIRGVVLNFLGIKNKKHSVGRSFGGFDVDDLTQECAIRIHQTNHLFEGQCQYSTWMYRICQNHLKNILVYNTRLVRRANVECMNSGIGDFSEKFMGIDYDKSSYFQILEILENNLEKSEMRDVVEDIAMGNDMVAASNKNNVPYHIVRKHWNQFKKTLEEDLSNETN